MVRIILIITILNLFSSCASQQCETITLLNGTTKVPKDFKICFGSTNFKELSNIEGINTNCIYENTETYNRYSTIKFYTNGKLSYDSFSYGTIYNENTFNPKINGLRGRLAKNIKNNKNYIQIYGVINHSGDWGIKTEEIEIKGDEIHIISKSGHISVFKKKIISKEFLSYEADW